MRKVILLLFSLYATTSVSQNIDKETIAAIECLSQGYIQYGVSELKKAASANDLAAQFFLATCYSKGIGVEVNNSEAFKLYRKTAERGLSDGQYFLALCYKEGIGVNIDDNKYNYWLDRFKKKGGKLLLPDVNLIYKEALNNPENYSLNPTQLNVGSQLQVENGSNRTGETHIIVNNIINKVEHSIIEPYMTQPDGIGSFNNKNSDVDDNIPITQVKNENTFAIIIGNEHYEDVLDVEFASRDADSFAKYCEMVLGVPETNIRKYKDASYGKMIGALEDIRSIAKAYDGDLNIIFYYAGHGIPNEKDFSSYLLPVDGNGRSTSLCLSLNNLYDTLAETDANRILVFLDACFSGSSRGDGMLTAARGVVIKAQPEEPRKNMVIFSASSEDETAYPLKDQGHGLFTYYLLKKLQESKGNLTLAELSKYINENVRKQSVVINRKSQTPTTSGTVDLNVNWFTK